MNYFLPHSRRHLPPPPHLNLSGCQLALWKRGIFISVLLLCTLKDIMAAGGFAF